MFRHRSAIVGEYKGKRQRKGTASADGMVVTDLVCQALQNTIKL
jgi:hypothetical protein